MPLLLYPECEKQDFERLSACIDCGSPARAATPTGRTSSAARVQVELRQEAHTPQGAKAFVRPPAHSAGLKFARIPAGEFWMGSPEGEKGRKAHEVRHRVRISTAFYMSVCAITQAQYTAVMGTNPSERKGDNLPVENVSWGDATAFCRTLSKKTGRKARLPTEAEWEYACRAGTETPYHFGSAITTKQANYGRYHGLEAMPAGYFPPSAWGLCEMHGNMWEWCADWYGDYPQGDVIDPQGPSSGSYRVLRGGAWGEEPWHCRSAHRSVNAPGSRDEWTGFRVVMDVFLLE